SANYLPRPPLRLLPLLLPLLLRPPPIEPDERDGGDTEAPPERPDELGRTFVGRDAGLAGRAELDGRPVDEGRTFVGRLVEDGRVVCSAGRRVVPVGLPTCPAGRCVPVRIPSRVRTSPEPDGLIVSPARVSRLPPVTDALLPPAALVTIRPLASRAIAPFGLRTAERAVRVLIRSRDAERGALVRLSTMTYPGYP